MTEIIDALARQVLARFGAAASEVRALGGHGGFSGARLWRVHTPAGDWCLKAWPPGGATPDHLVTIHRLMRQARTAGLPFVPEPFAAPGRSTFVEVAGRLWDLVSWMPGTADYRARPSRARLRAACDALARLHRAWEPPQPERRPFPAVRRRLDAARRWCELVAAGWRPDFQTGPDDALTRWSERAWRLAEWSVARVAEWLRPLADRRVDVQPCLCDVWHDHVLFRGESVSGLVDFGSLRPDHVTADLARLLGSLAGDDRPAFGKGMDAYHAVRPLLPGDAATVLLLDRAGTLLGVTNWLRWLYHERRQYEDRGRVADRLAELVRRAEKWL